MDQTAHSYHLGPKSGREISHFLAGLVIGLIAAVFIGAAVTVVASISSDQDLTLGGGVALGGILLAMGLPLAWFAVDMIREYTFRRAKLTIANGYLTINDPRGLGAPVVVPLTDVVASSVDKADAKEPMIAFPVMRSIGWSGAWAPGAMSDVQGYAIEPGCVRTPILPMGAKEVTLALIFRHPLRFDVSTKVEGERKKLKVVAHTSAIAIPARDAGAIAEHLAQLGVRPGFEVNDLVHIQPLTVEGTDGNFIKSTWREMGWAPAAHPVQGTGGFDPPLPAPQIRPAPARGQVELMPVESDAMGLAPATVNSRTKSAVTEYYVMMALVVIGIAGAGVLTLTWRINLLGPILIFLAGALGWLIFFSKINLDDAEARVELDPRMHPQMHRTMNESARQLNVSMPERVSVNFELTASAFSSRPDDFRNSGYDIEIGLPMFALANEREFSALIAHELTHARDDLERSGTIARAAVRAQWVGITQTGTFLGRVAGTVSNRFFKRLSKLRRESEYNADRSSALVAGGEPAASLLQKSVLADALLPIYWEEIIVPALELGMHPPIVAGFREFVQAMSERGELAMELPRMLNQDHLDSNDFSGHPSVLRRIANLDNPRAIQLDFSTAQPILQDDGFALETTLLARIGGAEQTAGLRPVTFTEAFPEVILHHWRRDVEQFQSAQPGDSVLDLPRIAKTAPDQGDVASLFGLALVAAGGQLIVRRPGDPVFVRINGMDIRPSETVEWLAKPETSDAEWAEHATRHALSGILLGVGAAAPAAGLTAA